MHNDKHSVIGKRVANVDGWEKVTGSARYTVDMELPGMLYGKILRSPHAHAKIVRIDTRRAEQLPGVKIVLTGKDTPGLKSGIWRSYRELCDEEILCREKVRYVGDAVATLAATQEDIAEEALSLIDVEYEILPAACDPLEAMKEDATEIHEGCERNMNVYRQIEWGDVEEAFEECDHIREDTFYCSSSPMRLLKRTVPLRVTHTTTSSQSGLRLNRPITPRCFSPTHSD